MAELDPITAHLVQQYWLHDAPGVAGPLPIELDSALPAGLMMVAASNPVLANSFHATWRKSLADMAG